MISFRLVFAIVLCLPGATASLRGPPRDLQQVPKFRNNYKGSFQYLLDGVCSGSKPVLQVLCVGSIEVLGTSHPTIQCNPLLTNVTVGSEVYSNGYECTNTCSDSAACQAIYLESGSIDDGAFGEIFFQCEGLSVEDTEGIFVYKESEGSCIGSWIGDGRNVHVAHLEVFCEERDRFVGTSQLFECREGISRRIVRDGFYKYTCLQGRNCGYDACDVDFARVVVEADLYLGQHCIQAIDGSEVPEIAAPTPQPRPPGNYSALFRANWQLEAGLFCTGTFPNVTVACLNGEIEGFETVHPSTSCEKTSPSDLLCQESDSAAFVDSYSGVEYTCATTNEKPTTRVDYSNGTITCDPIFRESNWHKVQLGVFCGSKFAGGDFDYRDYYSECSPDSYYRTEENDLFRFTCEARTIVPAGDRTPHPIASVGMFTDHRWANSDREECFEFKAATPSDNEGIPEVPTPAPSALPDQGTDTTATPTMYIGVP